MREIKFRALIDGKWYHFGLFDISAEGAVIKGGGDLHEAKAICEFTGLKDKNGKEIYEGDILLGVWGPESPQNHEVKWCRQYAGFEPFVNYDGDCGMEFNTKTCEAIGNVYENPELLDAR